VIRTSRVVRDAKKLNQLSAGALPLLCEDEPRLDKLAIDEDEVGFCVKGGEPHDDGKKAIFI
jgi:hypothetical protein